MVLLGPIKSRCCRTAGGRTVKTLTTCPNKVRVNKKVATRGMGRCLSTKTDRIVIASCIFRSKVFRRRELRGLMGTINGRRIILSLDYEEGSNGFCIIASH